MQALLCFVSKHLNLSTTFCLSHLTRHLDSHDKWNPTPAADLRCDCCSAHCIVQSLQKKKIKEISLAFLSFCSIKNVLNCDTTESYRIEPWILWTLYSIYSDVWCNALKSHYLLLFSSLISLTTMSSNLHVPLTSPWALSDPSVTLPPKQCASIQMDKFSLRDPDHNRQHYAIAASVCGALTGLRGE